MLERLHSGDPSALDELIDTYAPVMLRLASAITGSQESAEDVVQQVFIRVWDMRAKIDARGSLKSYLLQLTRNQAISMYRYDRAHDRMLEELDESDAVVNPHMTVTTAENLDVEELIDAIYASLEELPRRCREIFLLNWRDELEPREIAEGLGIGLATVRNQISRATTHLAAKLGYHLTHPDSE